MRVNTFKCLIDDSEIEYTAVTQIHSYLKKRYNETPENYYIKYVSDNNKCFFCNKKCKFLSVIKGYKELCGDKECRDKATATGTLCSIMFKHKCSEADALIIQQERALNRGQKIKNGLQESYDKDNDFFKKKAKTCKEYWLNRGYDEEYAVKESNRRSLLLNKGFLKDKIDNPGKYLSNNTTQLQYWLDKGLSITDANEAIRNRQTTFSLEKCIEKYGEDGNSRWLERQQKWLNTMNSKSEEEKKEINFRKLKHNLFYSKISQELFWSIYNSLNIKENVRFKELNDEYFLSKGNNFFLYDFVSLHNKKCIEFNGVFWHCKPGIYEKDYYHNIRRASAEDIWITDRTKMDLAIEKGFDVLVIWEDDYRKNKVEILNKCLLFLHN